MRLRVESDRIVELLHENAETCIMPYYNNLSETQVESKDNHDDLVTIADKESELFLRSSLTRMFPNTLVIGEEQVHQQPDAIRALEGDKPVWVIDPVDGTYNFRHAGEHFGVILSLIVNRVVVMGWHYFPLSNQVLAAEQGSGTWFDGQRCRIHSTDVSGSTLQTFLDVVNPRLFKKVLALVEPLGINVVNAFRCSAYDYLALVMNERQCLVSTSSKVWDHAAGQLMVREASGVCVHFNGQPYTPLYEHPGQICCPNDEFLEHFKPIFSLAP
jgi:fructose-1,6-bisphosphatase/inositol monophosphatase family enzyme